MFYAVALLIMVLTLRFALGHLRTPIPYDVLKVSKSGIVTARLLSAGFLVIPLTGLIYPVLHLLNAPPYLRWLDAPLPVGVLFCAPGLVVIHRLRSGLEIRGNQAKPMMAWLDRGALAGWIAAGSSIVMWLIATLPLLPPVTRVR